MEILVNDSQVFGQGRIVGGQKDFQAFVAGGVSLLICDFACFIPDEPGLGLFAVQGSRILFRRENRGDMKVAGMPGIRRVAADARSMASTSSLSRKTASYLTAPRGIPAELPDSGTVCFLAALMRSILNVSFDSGLCLSCSG